MPETLKHQVVKGLLWSGAERFSVQAVQFLVMIVIARILSPKDYGLIGMLSIFMAVAQSLIDSGFSQALIRKQNRTDVDNCTVFFFNIVVGVGLYLIFFAIAPLVARFYNEPQLCSLMRVLCLTVIINSLAIVQRAIFTVNIDFKTQAKASFTGAVVSGIVGIIMAVKGFGVWTLVWQQLISYGLNTLILWLCSSWRPRWLYSWKSFHELFSFGSKMLISGLLDVTYNNIYPLIIGKVFSATKLGFYTRARQFSEFPSSNVTGILQRVTYPALCKMQDDDERLRDAYRKFLRLSAFVVFPLMCGLAGVSKPFIIIVLGQKWEFCYILLIPLCLGLMWYPIHAINLNLLQVKGRSDLFLKLEIIKKIIGVTILCFSIQFGLVAMCYIHIFNSMLCLVINTYYTGKLIQVGYFMQMRDLMGTLLLSLSMFGLIFVGGSYIGNLWVWFIGGIVFGIAYYFFMAWVFKMKELSYLKSLKN
jgi:teichuronic acid exporter